MGLSKKARELLREVAATPGGVAFGLPSADPRRAQRRERWRLELLEAGLVEPCGFRTVVTAAGRDLASDLQVAELLRQQEAASSDRDTTSKRSVVRLTSAQLVNAVVDYVIRHGLAPDGAAGEPTVTIRDEAGRSCLARAELSYVVAPRRPR